MQKRGSDLGNEETWIEVQKKTFTRWTNSYLVKRKLQVDEITTDFQDGTKLGALLEIISGEKIAKLNLTPKIELQKTENLNKCLQFLRDHQIPLVNIGSQDVFKGNEKLILGLLWTIILRFEVGDGDGKNGLLLWVQRCCKGYRDVDPPNVQNFSQDWNTGLAFCALIHHFRPDLIKYDDLSREQAAENCELAFSVAEQKLGIPRLLDVQDVAGRSKPDEKSIVSYVAQFFKLFAKAQKNDALVKSIKNAVEVTKRHDAWLAKYAELSGSVTKWVSASQAKMSAPLAARSTDGVKKEFDAYTAYMRNEKPAKQAEKTEAEGIATQLTNSKRNNKRPEFNPAVTPEAMDSAWEALAVTESKREKELMDAYSRFRQVDNDSGIFMSRCGAVETWIKERSDTFAKGVPATASLTQIEGEMDNHASFAARYKQYQSVVDQLAQLEGQIKKTSNGQHDAEAAVSKKLSEIQGLMKALETAGQAHHAALQAAHAAEKAAVEAERTLAGMFDALDFDLDQIEVRANEPISVSSAAEVDAATKALGVIRSDLATAKGKVDGEVSQLTGKIASRRPQYAQLLDQEKTRCKTLEETLKKREALLGQTLAEESARDGVRDRFAQAANALAKNIDGCSKDLKDTSGSLEQQLARVRKIKERVNGPVKTELAQVDDIAKECDKHQIVSNSKTPHTIFTLRAAYDQLDKAVDESDQSINAQIMAKQALEITPEQLREIQEVFKFFDSDNTGFMELKELKEACTAAGIDLADDEIERKMAARAPGMKFNIDDFTAFMVGEMKSGDDLEHVLSAFKGLTEGADTISDQQLDSAFQIDPDLHKYVRDHMKGGDFGKFTTDLFSR